MERKDERGWMVERIDQPNLRTNEPELEIVGENYRSTGFAFFPTFLPALLADPAILGG